MVDSGSYRDDPEWLISVRIRGPTGTVSKATQNQTTIVKPNDGNGVTLLEMLAQAHIRLDNPDDWEIEALKHRSPDERARKNLDDKVKNVICHYRKRLSGHYCFYLVRRSPSKRVRVSCTTIEPIIVPRTPPVDNIKRYPSGKLLKKTIFRHDGHGRSHASPAVGESGLDGWRHCYHKEGSGRMTNGGTFERQVATNAMLQDKYSIPKNGQNKLAKAIMGAAGKVNMHTVGRSSGAKPISAQYFGKFRQEFGSRKHKFGANARVAASGNAQQNGPMKHRFESVGFMRNPKFSPRSDPGFKEIKDIMLAALKKQNENLDLSA